MTLEEQAKALRKGQRPETLTEALESNESVAKILAEHSERMGGLLASYEQKMTQQYEDIVKAATKDIETKLGMAESQPEQKPAAPAGKFQAFWIKENGENWLALNQPAAEYLSLIFDQLADVLTEIQKGAKKPAARAR